MQDRLVCRCRSYEVLFWKEGYRACSEARVGNVNERSTADIFFGMNDEAVGILWIASFAACAYLIVGI